MRDKSVTDSKPEILKLDQMFFEKIWLTVKQAANYLSRTENAIRKNWKMFLSPSKTAILPKPPR